MKEQKIFRVREKRKEIEEAKMIWLFALQLVRGWTATPETRHWIVLVSFPHIVNLGFSWVNYFPPFTPILSLTVSPNLAGYK